MVGTMEVFGNVAVVAISHVSVDGSEVKVVSKRVAVSVVPHAVTYLDEV